MSFLCDWNSRDCLFLGEGDFNRLGKEGERNELEGRRGERDVRKERKNIDGVNEI